MSAVVGRVEGRVAAVTGAGSGIGRALAYELAKRGARLSVSDLDEAGLAETAERVTALGAPVLATRVDVTDRVAVATYAQATVERFGVVHEIYNNAGIAGAPRSVLEADYADLERVIDVDLWGVIHGSKEFLPHLVASGAGRIVNISSLNGLFAQPGLAGYCTAKFAVRGFTEALRGEVVRDRLPVRVTVVHPGGVRTGIALSALSRTQASDRPLDDAAAARVRRYHDRLLRMDPVRAATIILDGVAAGRGRILVGGDARAMDALVRLAPSGAPRLAARLERALGPGRVTRS